MPVFSNVSTNGRKVVLVGAGLVGTSYAFALLNQKLCEQMVIIDLDRRRAEAEAMDLSHGLAFSDSGMRIFAGDYPDCADADLLVICAGVPQISGESRIALYERNRAVVEDIVRRAAATGFAGIILVATNPVDLMTLTALRCSGFPARRVIGSGTTLDTARLKHLLGGYFGVDSRNIHAYVIGEHGDSELVPWSQAMVATKSVWECCDESPDRFDRHRLLEMEADVRNAAQSIIEAKRATYYGIGMALARITRAIFGDENSVLTVSSLLEGEYGQHEVCIGTPCIINREGVREKVRLNLPADEWARFNASCDFLRSTAKNGGAVLDRTAKP